MAMAKIAAMRSSCISRQVGCVLVDEHHHVLSTGYNGSAVGVPNCCDTYCSRANVESGESLEMCEAVHAEQNALLQCPDTNKIFACYVTASPCYHCAKLLMNTSCQQIFFAEEYPNFESIKYKWENSVVGREINKLGYINIKVIHD